MPDEESGSDVDEARDEQLEEQASLKAVGEAETQIEEEPEKIEGYEQPTFKKVKNVQFGVLSPKMIKKMASAKIVTPELYDKEGYPVDGGLMDIRLGVIDPGLKCKTCGSKNSHGSDRRDSDFSG